jgi:hypothetical protein
VNWIIQTTWLIAATILAGTPHKNPSYLDPGSGSFIFQLILASLLGAAVILRAYWKRIAGFIKNIVSRKSDDRQE